MTHEETCTKLSKLEDKLIEIAIKLKRVYFDNERYFDTVQRSIYQCLDNPSYSYGSQGELSYLLVENPKEYLPELERTIEEYKSYQHAADCDGYGLNAAQRGFDTTRPIGLVWTYSTRALLILAQIKEAITDYLNDNQQTNTTPHPQRQSNIALAYPTNTTTQQQTNTTTTMRTITTPSEYITAVNEAKLHNHLYWVENKNIISDAEFDDLISAIEQYEQQHPEQVLPDTPTREVGCESGAHTIPHRIPMLSTEKCKTVDKVKSWMKKTSKQAAKIIDEGGNKFRNCSPNYFALEWKYDGVSCSLVYQDGILIEASTRGDTKLGLGKDILGHFTGEYRVKGVPTRLNYRNELNELVPVPGRVEVRGEVVCPHFAYPMALNKYYPDQRTAAASVLNTAPSETDMQIYLLFVAWQLITDDATIMHPTKQTRVRACNHLHNMDILRWFGFFYSEPLLIEEDDVEEYIAALTEQRASLPYPTDGLIIKYYDNRLWPLFGSTEHHPKYLLAYKFRPEGAETTVRSIDITIGEKTGKKTPIAHFDPVTIGGKQYSKCSLGSEAIMEQKGIREGSRVVVVIANDVIPQIDRVIEQ